MADKFFLGAKYLNRRATHLKWKGSVVGRRTPIFHSLNTEENRGHASHAAAEVDVEKEREKVVVARRQG